MEHLSKSKKPKSGRELPGLVLLEPTPVETRLPHGDHDGSGVRHIYPYTGGAGFGFHSGENLLLGKEKQAKRVQNAAKGYPMSQPAAPTGSLPTSNLNRKIVEGGRHPWTNNITNNVKCNIYRKEIELLPSQLFPNYEPRLLETPVSDSLKAGLCTERHFFADASEQLRQTRQSRGLNDSHCQFCQQVRDQARFGRDRTRTNSRLLPLRNPERSLDDVSGMDRQRAKERFHRYMDELTKPGQDRGHTTDGFGQEQDSKPRSTNRPNQSNDISKARRAPSADFIPYNGRGKERSSTSAVDDKTYLAEADPSSSTRSRQAWVPSRAQQPKRPHHPFKNHPRSCLRGSRNFFTDNQKGPADKNGTSSCCYQASSASRYFGNGENEPPDQEHRRSDIYPQRSDRREWTGSPRRSFERNRPFPEQPRPKPTRSQERGRAEQQRGREWEKRK